jgi:Mn-dependent DtxR family transcriptional regulator
MSGERGKGDHSETPLSNTLSSNDKYLPDTDLSMVALPDKLERPSIPHFREKPVQHLVDGFCLIFRELNDLEYWICEEQKKGSYFVQWLEFRDTKPQKFHRMLSNRNGLDVENKKRDQSLVKYLHTRTGIEKTEISEYLEEVGIFIGENRHSLSPEYDETSEEDVDTLEDHDQSDEISEERRKELIEILKKPDLLSFIDEALYERSPDDGFIIGEVESKHTLNFNCVGARLGLSTINTLKGASSIGKTNTANVVTGLHRTKKVGSLSDTALKYADDLHHIDILYIQETLEEEFKNKETRLMSADDGGFIAETTIKNPKTGEFEVQQTTIPVKTLVTTTTAIELDPEFASRNFIIPVDDSEEQTKRILEENFKSTEKKLQEIKGEMDFNIKYMDIKDSYNLLKIFTVLIPYEADLLEIFPTSNPRARRDSKKLMQLIKESALLFQFQRCRAELNDQPVLVASWADLAHAIILGGPILEATLTGFDKRLIEALPVIYELIDEKGYVTTRSLHKKLKKSSKYAWQILNFFEDNGYIYHDSETKRNMGIKGKAKVYIKTGAREYKNLLLAIGNIDWFDIKNKEETFIKEQIPNSSHQVGDCIYLPHYDPTAPNKVVYKQTPIHSEEFGIYQNKTIEHNKTLENNSEILNAESRNIEHEKIVKQTKNAEIDYRNLTTIEKAILTELASFRKHTIGSLIEELKSKFQAVEIRNTINDMEGSGWLS